MKKITIIALLMSVCVLGAFAKKGRQPIAFKQLPKVVKQEVKQIYTPKEVQLITSEKKAFRHYEFTLILDDGSQVVFNEKAQVIKAKSEQGVKDIFIPTEIAEYIKATFPHAVITEYEKDSNKQVIVLNDTMTLVFKKNGKFLRIDD